MPPATGHVPVLLDEVLHTLQPASGKLYVDATLGGGGHSRAILDKSAPDGRLIGLDQDQAILAQTRQGLADYGERVRFIHCNYSAITQALQEAGESTITGGVLADIGVSSFQLDQADRGFSFSKEALLDMRMDATQPLTAEAVVNEYPESQLIQIFSEYGEERFSKTIAKAIVQARQESPIKTTTELSKLVSGIYHQILKGKPQRIHPATCVFQAIRIEVNDELGHLQRFLEQLPALLSPGARIVIISFHSLEDRIIKRFFQQQSVTCVCPPRFPVCQCNHQATLKLLTGKPVMATEQEIEKNPRSRSAKLRCAERL